MALNQPAGSGAQASKKPTEKNVVVNGDFEKVVDGQPDGWSEAGLTVLKEKDNTFVRFEDKPINRDGTCAYHAYYQS